MNMPYARVAVAAASLILAGCAAPAAETVAIGPTGHWDLIQAELAFGDRAPDMPPQACWEQRETATGQQCLARNIIALHVEDLDDDGLDDLIALRQDGSVSAYRNLGGTFETLDGVTWPEGLVRTGKQATYGLNADLNGDGRPELLNGAGRSVPDETEEGPFLIMLAPIVHDGVSGERVHLLDLERRRIIGFSELIYVGDMTGDLVPDLVLAGQGMEHPHLYVNTSPAGVWGSIAAEHDLRVYHEREPEQHLSLQNLEGAVTWRRAQASIGTYGKQSASFMVEGEDGRESSITVEAGRVSPFG